MEHKTYHGRPVIWSPQPRQAAFMARTEDEALYGGAAGGGKSDALIIEALRQVHIPHYRALILRKTYPQLSELIDKTMRYYKPVFPKARYNGSSHCWTFPSGAKIYFGSLNHTQDKYNYQGKAFDFIGVDELTHFTWDEYSYVMSRNRPSGPGTRVYIRATANPGGVGHGWVKARFISPAPAGTRMVDTAKDVVHLVGRLDERGFMELETAPLPSNTIAYQQNRVAELKEISGNRDVNQGGATSGLTAASAIAALQEAGSKLSRDMLKSSYRSFAKECYFIIDLMRQFYDEERVYRITGQQGGTEYREFSGQMLRPQPVESVGGVELGAHEPVFDITVSAAKKSTFSRLSQNETAKECYQLGFFAPANADAALACLDMMDFEGIEKVRQRVAQNGTLYQQLQQAMAQIQQMAAVIDQQNGSNLSEQAGAAAAAMTGGGGGGETSAKTVTNSLGGQVGGGTNPLATKAAERAMNINDPNK